MTFNQFNQMERDVPKQESAFFNSFLLKRDLEIYEVGELGLNELELLLAETKIVTTSLYVGGAHRKLMAAYFYEYALLKYQNRTKE